MNAKVNKIAECTNRFRWRWGIFGMKCIGVAILVAMAAPNRIGAGLPQEVGKPMVVEAVAPQVYEHPLSQLSPLRPYKPGDPVKLIEDLRGSEEGGEEKGGSNPPVSPQSLNVDLSKMPKAETYRPGDPVHLMSDLRESGGTTTLARRSGNSFKIDANFDGIPATGFLPPDVAGAVGPRNYVLMVNVAFAIYDKHGHILAGPSPINSLWASLGPSSPCAANNNGDPIVRYDHLADRWLMAQFALPGGAVGYHECVAISRSGDPVTGGWFLYDFPMKDATGAFVFPDYPKIGVWHDGYYMGTQRGFPSGGLDVWSFERGKMLAGAPARAVHFAVSPPSLILLPADLDGAAPPVGSPELFGRQVDGARFGGTSRFEVFAFHVDWSNPSASTFKLDVSLPTAPFASTICQGSLLETCIPQPGVTTQLEALTAWTMWRLQYRKFEGHEVLVTNHTINVGSKQAGIRWYELRRRPRGAWTIFQQGTFSPDATTARWMGSIAMNKVGEMALGYSASSSSVFPSIRFAAREDHDPAGTLGAEINLQVGSGSQTFPVPRWGNYTTMDIDPEDGCTFWYAGEYMPSTSPAGWLTHVSSFRSADCPRSHH